MHLAPGVSLVRPYVLWPAAFLFTFAWLPFLPFGIQLGFCVQPLSPLVFSLPMTPKTESSPALTEHWTQAPCVSLGVPQTPTQLPKLHLHFPDLFFLLHSP